MHKSKCVVVVAWVGILACALLAGCSEAKTRQSGKQVLDEVATARALSERAGALMSSLVYEDTVSKEITPLTRKNIRATKVEDIKLYGPNEVNPKALEILNQAHDGLSKALQQNPDAPAADMALGYGMLGRIEMLRGDYHGALTRLDECKAQLAMLDAEKSLDLAQTMANLVSNLQTMASVSDEELLAAISKAKESIAKLEKEQTAATDQIGLLQSQVAELDQANKKLVDEATALRSQSDEATGDKRLDLFDRATEQEKSIDANLSKLGALKQNIDSLRSASEAAGLKLRAATARQRAAENLLASRKTTRNAAIEEQAKAATELTAAQAKIATDAASVDQAMAQAAKDRQEAVKFYEQAGADFRKAVQAAPSTTEITGQASASKSVARLAYGQLESQEMLSALLDDAQSLFKNMGKEMPAAMSKLKSYIVPADTLRQAAGKRYDDAVRFYTQALSSLPSDRKWSVQAQIAGAYAGLYQMSGKEADLAQAKKFLEQALERKASSPYLQNVLQLQRALSRLGSAGPAAPPPSVPASPGTTLPAEETPAASAPAAEAVPTASMPSVAAPGAAEPSAETASQPVPVNP